MDCVYELLKAYESFSKNDEVMVNVHMTHALPESLTLFAVITPSSTARKTIGKNGSTLCRPCERSQTDCFGVCTTNSAHSHLYSR